ncbi:tyrosine-type recombinase/integrase, partial [Streptomyces katrae]
AGSLRRTDSNAFVDELIGKGLAASYVHQVFKTWRIFVHWMVDEKEIPLPANIVSRIKLPEIPKRKVVDLTPQQVARIAECIEPRFEVLVWEAACGGVREGEAFGMTKDRVDFLRRRWHIAEQRQKGQAVKTKTKASMTWVSVDQFLLDKIAAHLAAGYDRPAQVQHATELRRIRRQAQGVWTPPVDEGLIVTNHAGRPLTRQTFHPYWREAVEEAGVDPDARFHDLKGFYTRTLATSGNHDPKTVQRLSRHARFEETWDTYAETGAGAEDVKVIAFSSAFTATGDEDPSAAAV